MTLATAKQRWAKRRRRYAVGYIDAGNVTYAHFPGHRDIKRPMTLKEARLQLARMPSPGAAIFTLEPMEMNR